MVDFSLILFFDVIDSYSILKCSGVYIDGFVIKGREGSL